jgi:hypothetical protein
MILPPGRVNRIKMFGRKQDHQISFARIAWATNALAPD